MTIQANAINSTHQKTLELITRLTSGSRINKASDDAAGLAISQRQTSQINGLYQATKNLGDGVSLVQTADSALQHGTDVLQRMRELSVQANNGILNSSDRANLQKEIDQLKSEFDSLSENTQFNNQKIFDGNFSANIQVGDSFEGIKIQLNELSELVGDIDVTTTENADAAIQNIDNALEDISNTRSELGATHNRFESAINELHNASVNHNRSRSAIFDTDFAADLSENEQNNILSKVQMAMMKKEDHNKTFLMELFN